MNSTSTTRCIQAVRVGGAKDCGIAIYGDPSAPQKFIGWLAGFLQSYETFVHDAYELQLTRVQQQADVTVDGRAPVEKIVAAVIAGIEDRTRRAKAAASP